MVIIPQFFRFFYSNTQYTYLPEGEDDESNKKVDVFNSSEFSDVDIEVTVESIGGTNASVAGDINALESALKIGAITPKQYFEMYPKDALSNRGEILRVLEDAEAQQVAQLTQTIEQMRAQMEADRKAVDSVGTIIAENDRLKAQLAEVEAKSIALAQEATQKIAYANQQLIAADQMIKRTIGDAQQMATQIARERGMI